MPSRTCFNAVPLFECCRLAAAPNPALTAAPNLFHALGGVYTGPRLWYISGMRLVSPDELPLQSVSHDPHLKKKVLIPGGVLPHIRTLSHIELGPGDRASEHVHEDGYEVFYGLGGKINFTVEGRTVVLSEGMCLVVEPGEAHSVEGAEEGSRMLYFLLKR